MIGSCASIRLPILYATVAVTTASATAIAYRYLWYRKCDYDGDYYDKNKNNDYDNRSSRAPSQQQHDTVRNIKPPLRNVTPRPGEQSRIVYLTGIDKQTGEDELVELFSSGRGTAPVPIEIDASEIERDPETHLRDTAGWYESAYLWSIVSMACYTRAKASALQHQQTLF